MRGTEVSPLAFGAMLLLVGAVGFPASAEVLNGGFETGTLGGWSWQHSYYGSGAYAAQSANAFEGQCVATVETLSTGPYDCYSQISQSFVAEEGNVLRLALLYQVAVQSYQWESPPEPWEPPGTPGVLYMIDGEAQFSITVVNTSTLEEASIFGGGTMAAGGDQSGYSSFSQWSEVSHEFTQDGTYELICRTDARLWGGSPPPSDDPMQFYARSCLVVDGIELVPEPATLCLLALGGLALIRGKRK